MNTAHTFTTSEVSAFDADRFNNELGLIGGLLAYGDASSYRAAAAVIGPEHFSDIFNARLFSLIGQGVDAGLSLFPLMKWLIGRLHNDETLNGMETSASAMITKYVSGASPAIAIEASARQVKHDWLSLILSAAVATGDTAEAETTAAEMERLSHAHLDEGNNAETMGAVSGGVVERLNKAFMEGRAPEDFAYAGTNDLSRILGGWRAGKFYVIAGRPGMGKSTAALSVLLRTAAKGHGVMFFSLEMGKDELTEMALCDLAWHRNRRVEYRDIAISKVTEEGFQKRFEQVLEVEPLLRSMPFMISDKAGQTLASIRSMAMREKQRLEATDKRLRVICIDHLGLVAPTGNYKGNKVAETEEISMGLKKLAKELGCAVIALAQLNRGVEGKDDKRPSLADLRWSGSIEQDADVVAFVYREAYYLERKKFDDISEESARLEKLKGCVNKMELIFGKHRGGPCPILELFCDVGCAVVRDMEVHHG